MPVRTDNVLRKQTATATDETRERWLRDALAQQRIVVTRAGTQGTVLVNRLHELGATPLHYPAITFAPPTNVAALRHAAEHLAGYDWLVFTSANAVQAVADHVFELHGHLHVAMPAIATVGQATAAAVSALGWPVQYVAERGGGLALAASLPVKAQSKILLPRADIASADVPNVLRDRDCVVHEVVAYRTVANSPALVAQLANESSADAVMFTSPSTVAAFVAAATAAGWNLRALQQTRELFVACIGETTAAAAREHNLRVDAIAIEPSSEGLIEALAHELHRRRAPVAALTQDLRSI